LLQYQANPSLVSWRDRNTDVLKCIYTMAI
jgi:hypothetical protein